MNLWCRIMGVINFMNFWCYYLKLHCYYLKPMCYSLTAAPPSNPMVVFLDTLGYAPVSAAAVLDGGGWLSFLVVAVVSSVSSVVVLS